MPQAHPSTSKNGILVALLVLLAAAVWLWQSTRGDPRGETDTDTDGVDSVQEEQSGAADARSGAGALSKRETIEAATKSKTKESSSFVLSGRVIAGDRAVAGAEVSAFDTRAAAWSRGDRRKPPVARATAGPDGRFEVSVTHAPLHLIAVSDGLLAKDALVVYRRGDRRDLELPLFTSRKVRGKVVDERSVPVGGAQITVGPIDAWKRRRTTVQAGVSYEPLPSVPCASDEHGAFDCTLPDGEGWRFAASGTIDGGRTVGRASLDVSRPWTSALVLTLSAPKTPPEFRLWGYTVDPSGGPVSGVELLLRPNDEKTTSDAEGRFVFDSVPESGDTRLLAGADEFTAALLKIGSITADSGPIYVRLARELTITGLLVEADGKPVPGARIKLSGDPVLLRRSVPPPTLLSLFSRNHAVTNEDGRFAFRGLARQSYRLSWRSNSDASRIAVAEVAAGTKDVRLVVGVVRAREAAISGMLVDAITSSPIAGAVVSASCFVKMEAGTGSYGVAHARTDERGRFAIRGLTDGDYRLSCTPAGYAGCSLEPRRYDIGRHEVLLRASPARRLSVQVLDAAGKGVPQVSLYAADAEGRSLMTRTASGGGKSPMYTDDKGRAVLHGLPAKMVTITAKSSWWQPGATGLANLRPEKPGELALRLTTVRGGKNRTVTVPLHTSSGGSAVLGKGCTVVVEDSRGRLVTRARGYWKDGEFLTQTTDLTPRGSKNVELVLFAPSEACRVRISAPGYAEARIDIPAGKNEFPVVLQPR